MQRYLHALGEWFNSIYVPRWSWKVLILKLLFLKQIKESNNIIMPWPLLLLLSYYCFLSIYLSFTNMKRDFVYQKAFYKHFTPAFWLHNNICEFTALAHKIKSWFCIQKTVFNHPFEDFWYTKINLTQIQVINIKGKKIPTHTIQSFNLS